MTHDRGRSDQRNSPSAAPIPLAMLAELTHRCPLKCLYCSNPLELEKRSNELTTDMWASVFAQAADLGVLQVHLSGGEPAARSDLPEIVAAASAAGLYTNLITSGLGFRDGAFTASVTAGLDHVQLSIQGADDATSDRVSGTRNALSKKIAFAKQVRAEGLPLTINAVVHKLNLDTLDQTIERAVSLSARRLEVAHAQYHGWAFRNQHHLLPSREQIERAAALVASARTALAGQLAIDHVLPDYFSKYPKACMGGWGRVGLNVTPNGTVLPCHAAETLTHLSFETVHNASLAAIWNDGAAFNAYRGTDWMPEPCRSCSRKEIDWGGCRCQALALTGHAAATDPACALSPDHDLIAEQSSRDVPNPPVAAPVYRGY